METMTLKDKVILGFYDDVDETEEIKMACRFEAIDEKYYDEAIREAIEQAQEDGYWNEIKSMNPEDQLIELETQYSELFDLAKLEKNMTDEEYTSRGTYALLNEDLEQVAKFTVEDIEELVELSKPFCIEEFNQYFVINVNHTELPVAMLFNNDGDIFLDCADTGNNHDYLNHLWGRTIKHDELYDYVKRALDKFYTEGIFII